MKALFRWLPRVVCGMKIFGIGLILSLLLTGDAVALEWVSIPEPPKGSGKVIEVKRTIVIKEKGKVIDYKGARLVWKGRGDCSQKEGMPPIIVIDAKDVTLKNAIIEEAPDGIHVLQDDAVIENVIFPKVCEDAITLSEASDRAEIRNCYFANARDKAIQVNRGRGHLIRDNTFVRVSQAVRVADGAEAEFTGNRVYKSRIGLHVSGSEGKAYVGGNRFYEVGTRYSSREKADIVNRGGDRGMLW